MDVAVDVPWQTATDAFSTNQRWKVTRRGHEGSCCKLSGGRCGTRGLGDANVHPIDYGCRTAQSDGGMLTIMSYSLLRTSFSNVGSSPVLRLADESSRSGRKRALERSSMLSTRRLRRDTLLALRKDLGPRHMHLLQQVGALERSGCCAGCRDTQASSS